MINNEHRPAGVQKHSHVQAEGNNEIVENKHQAARKLKTCFACTEVVVTHMIRSEFTHRIMKQLPLCGLRSHPRNAKGVGPETGTPKTRSKSRAQRTNE